MANPSGVHLSGTNNSGDKSSLLMGDNSTIRKKMAAPSDKFVAVCLILNIGCSIAIVLINKHVYTDFGFPNVTLTCFHFIVTSVGLVVCHQLNLFQPKRLPVLQMLPLALTFCGFVVFTNLSLETNTVGTYQLIKTMTTPCIMFIQTYYYAKTFSTKVKLTVVSMIFISPIRSDTSQELVIKEYLVNTAAKSY